MDEMEEDISKVRSINLRSPPTFLLRFMHYVRTTLCPTYPKSSWNHPPSSRISHQPGLFGGQETGLAVKVRRATLGVAIVRRLSLVDGAWCGELTGWTHDCKTPVTLTFDLGGRVNGCNCD